jgi:hypothetical protein
MTIFRLKTEEVGLSATLQCHMVPSIVITVRPYYLTDVSHLYFPFVGLPWTKVSIQELYWRFKSYRMLRC